VTGFVALRDEGDTCDETTLARGVIPIRRKSNEDWPMRAPTFLRPLMVSLAAMGCILPVFLLTGQASRSSPSPAVAASAAEVGPIGPDSPSPAQGRGQMGPMAGVYKDSVEPHWIQGNERFWYVNKLRGNSKEFVLVDVAAGARKPAFDHGRLAVGLSQVVGSTYQPDKLPVDTIQFDDSGQAVLFTVGSTTWRCDLASYQCAKSSQVVQPTPSEGVRPTIEPDEEPSVGEALIPPPPPPQGGRRGGRVGEEITPETPGNGTDLAKDPPFFTDSPSPDGQWTAVIKNFNVVVRGRNGQETQLTQDGADKNFYGMLSWSPDSKTLLTSKIDPAEHKDVHWIESSPAGGGRARLRNMKYPLPGDKYTSYELHAIDLAGRKVTKVDAPPIDFFGPWKPRWRADGKFLMQKADRGHQRFRVFEVDPKTGATRTILDDKADTFVSTMYESFIYYTQGNEGILYTSERDGWKHLYLYDSHTGLKNQVTKGEWVVRGVSQVDEANRQIWLRASGKNPGQDPYLIHHYRVNFDGTGLTALTEANGSHTITYSPDRKYIIDSYSRVDMAPATELRRVSDGKLVCKLEESDITELKASGWEAPEVFVSKGRDNKTDIWGVIARPRNVDPNKKYPVLEYIYAGPHSSYVPKTFSGQRRWSNYTDLGFIVVQMDGMGTAHRSKAFHDVCWHDLGDAGFPDRILWHKAVAAKYPYYDTTRVGIWGGSAGGQNSTGALLFHPEFYKVAVSSCGCHDNRMDKASWNEQWMGYPVGPHYGASSNIDNAHKLQGKLLLIVGELDNNVPPESTYRLCDALIKAGKDFDLLVVPGAGHGSGGPYGARRSQDFFVRHLLGVEPPNRNSGGRGGE
jgi:hypothetical protein